MQRLGQPFQGLDKLSRQAFAEHAAARKTHHLVMVLMNNDAVHIQRGKFIYNEGQLFVGMGPNDMLQQGRLPTAQEAHDEAYGDALYHVRFSRTRAMIRLRACRGSRRAARRHTGEAPTRP